METIGLLLLKSAAWLTGFALVFLLVLRNERFFRLNRFYLVAGIIASLIFPFYTFHYNVVIPSTLTDSAAVGQLMPGGVVSSESALPFFYWIYLAGISAFFSRLLFQTWKIIRKLQQSGYEKTGSVKLVRSSEYASTFSFFSYVFVNPSTSAHEMEEIMNHEREHIQQRHWFDLLLVELICIVQWFNPFAWIYAHLVRQNHEYLADERALQNTADPAIYQAALLNQLLGVPVFSLTNSFSYSLNKKRFKMMKKKIDSPVRKLKMLLVLPMAAMLFYAFAVPEYQYVSEPNTVAPQATTFDVKGQVFKADGTTPMPGTSVILRNSTTGTLSDPDGNFVLKGIPAGSELVFSFVGFKSKVLKVESQPMKVVMEVGKVGIEQVTVVGYGTPPPPPPPPPAGKARNEEVVVVGYGKTPPGLTPPSSKVSLRAIDNANPPLFYLDGVKIDKKTMEQINPDLIASISVLKDNSATAVYGEEGKNGVILITSKAKAGTAKAQMSDQVITSNQREDDVFVVVEVMPEFPGGEIALREFIGKTIKYPEDAKNNGIQGKVYVTFVVKKDGTVGSAKIARGVHPLLDNEAMRVVGILPTWKPGQQGGKAVNVSYTIPVAFALSGNNEQKKTTSVQTSAPQTGEKVVFVVVEEMPEFPGGSEELRNFIAKEIRYPEDAKKNGIQGKVFVSFVVNSRGKVEDAKIERSVSPSLDNEAIRVVNLMPEWKPGKQRGQAVSVSYTIPIEFKLQ